jgi:hypothetical protein
VDTEYCIKQSLCTNCDITLPVYFCLECSIINELTKFTPRHHKRKKKLEDEEDRLAERENKLRRKMKEKRKQKHTRKKAGGQMEMETLEDG